MRAPSTLRKSKWPPNYVDVFMWRQAQLQKLRSDPKMLYGALKYYQTRPVEFINHWVDTYDPRKAGKGLVYMPMVMFRRQEEFVEFLKAVLEGEENALIEKCRDMGATWICVAFSVWLWRFSDGASIGWGSRKSDYVDRLGIMDSIFEKIRALIRRLPREFWPQGFDPDEHMPFMRIINPETGAVISGESGDSIGRGGRNLIYFKDESAHYERPELIEAALGDNTRIQVDISSVNGVGNVFHRKREAGEEWIDGPAISGVTNVFVMDWRDHPEKNEAWYRARKQNYTDQGMDHVFAQEVDRRYDASVVGTIIKLEWVQAAYDAHIKLGVKYGGRKFSGLDVADGDDVKVHDRNAQAMRTGVVLDGLDEWGERDTGATTRRAIANVSGRVEIQYDCIGVGAGVKAEANRLEEDELLPTGVKLVAWAASSKVLEPESRVVADDEQSLTNEEFYANLKAQGWWELRKRFELTYRAIEEGIDFDPDKIISISTEHIPVHMRRKLEKELTQVTKKQSTGSMKMVINKAPDGTKSPNLADAVMMAYWPLPDETYTLENL